MNIESTLSVGQNKTNTTAIVKYIGKDPRRFKELMEVFFRGEYRLTQRAAWPMSYCVQAHPELINPYFKRMLDSLDREGMHAAVLRNVVRLLQDVEIPSRYQGRVMDLCFRLVEAPETAIAVKAFSLTILENLSKLYPEILPELKTMIESQWDQATPAFRSRARKILKAIECKK